MWYRPYRTSSIVMTLINILSCRDSQVATSRFGLRFIASEIIFVSQRYAPTGQHTGYAYCHVPNGSTVDMADAIENQTERFAPGFKETILAKQTISPQAFEAHNPNFVGGAVTGGAADMTQLFTRPVARLDPYSTPKSPTVQLFSFNATGGRRSWNVRISCSPKCPQAYFFVNARGS